MQYSLTVLANTINQYCEIDESAHASWSLQESAFNRWYSAMRSYRGTRQFCDRRWCPTLDWRKESATIVHTSLMAGKSNNGVNKPGCPTVVCGPKKIGSCSYSVYSPSICPFEYPFLYNQLHQTFSYFTLFAPLTATSPAPSPSRLQSPLFMDPTNYPNLSLRLYQISRYFL